MNMEEVDKLEKEINEAYGRAIKNFQDYFQNDLKTLETKKDVINSVKEIFENSLRMIREEKRKINQRGDI